MKTGFAGTGIMGSAMAVNVLKSGFDLMVYNRTREKTSELEKMGAAVVNEASRLGEACNTIILMLTGPNACDEVLFGSNGILKNHNISVDCIINMSTVTPEYAVETARKLEEKNIGYIDCPVSGSKGPATEGTLILLAGGAVNLISRHERLLLSMGKRIINCGETGRGSVMKLGVNLLLGNMMASLSEAVNFSQKFGIKNSLFMETILSGPLGCALFALKSSMFESEEFPPQFPLKHIHKDMGFALEMSHGKVSLPCAESSFSLYSRGLNFDLGDEDFASVIKIIQNRDLNG